jgi:hypothetical protein
MKHHTQKKKIQFCDFESLANLSKLFIFLEFKLKIISKNFCHHSVQIRQEKNC